MGVVFVATGASDAPTADDMTAITALVDKWMDANTNAWPSASIARPELSEAESTQIDAKATSTAAQVATDEFAEMRAFSWAGFLQEMRDVDGTVLVENEYKILRVSFDRMTRLDDVVVSVSVWVGETQAEWSAEKAALVNVRRIDTTPADEYVVRKVAGEWRLADVRHVEMSEDDDPDAYGVDTPHDQLPIDGEWLVGGD
jgi:hypothetical protein